MSFHGGGLLIGWLWHLLQVDLLVGESRQTKCTQWRCSPFDVDVVVGVIVAHWAAVNHQLVVTATINPATWLDSRPRAPACCSALRCLIFQLVMSDDVNLKLNNITLADIKITLPTADIKTVCNCYNCKFIASKLCLVVQRVLVQNEHIHLTQWRIQRGARGHASQTHDHLKKSCESRCRHDSVFRRWQWLNLLRTPYSLRITVQKQTLRWAKNAPKYALWDPKIKNFSGEGVLPLLRPNGEGDTPSLYPPSYGMVLLKSDISISL